MARQHERAGAPLAKAVSPIACGGLGDLKIEALRIATKVLPKALIGIVRAVFALESAGRSRQFARWLY
jgi:hypothetical protein